MRTFILGYPIGKDIGIKNLKKYKTIGEADYETEEWVVVEANTLREAKRMFEKEFIKWQRNQQL